MAIRLGPIGLAITRFLQGSSVPVVRYEYTVADSSAPRYAIRDSSGPQYAMADSSAPRYAVRDT